jgi:hypothetical protein
MEERFEGYVVDLECARMWPQAEWEDRAKRHTVTCSLHGSSIESGYCIIDSHLVPLDANATPLVLHRLRESDHERGVRLRITRRAHDREMVTTMIDLAISREPVTSSTVRSVGYHDGILEIEFKSGIYQYLDVPKKVYDELLHADSHGRFFNQEIKNKFQSRKLEI